jgi:hypothetical protein
MTRQKRSRGPAPAAPRVPMSDFYRHLLVTGAQPTPTRRTRTTSGGARTHDGGAGAACRPKRSRYPASAIREALTEATPDPPPYPPRHQRPPDLRAYARGGGVVTTRLHRRPVNSNSPFSLTGDSATPAAEVRPTQAVSRGPERKTCQVHRQFELSMKKRSENGRRGSGGYTFPTKTLRE